LLVAGHAEDFGDMAGGQTLHPLHEPRGQPL
jgi:hypothetical protein